MSKNHQTNFTRVEVSADQKTAKSLRFGALTFVPTDPRIRKLDCEKCILKGEPECAKAPCNEVDRDDKLNGYWFKHIDRLNENQQ